LRDAAREDTEEEDEVKVRSIDSGAYAASAALDDDDDEEEEEEEDVE
jgi:hypothetical protein